MVLTRWDIVVLLFIAFICSGFLFAWLDNIYYKMFAQNRKYYERIRDFTDAEDKRYNEVSRELTIIKLKIEKIKT